MTWCPKNKKELINLFIKAFSITAAFTEIWIRFGVFCQDQYQMLTKRRGLRKVLSQPSCSALICPPFSVLAAPARCENLQCTHPLRTQTHRDTSKRTYTDRCKHEKICSCLLWFAELCPFHCCPIQCKERSFPRCMFSSTYFHGALPFPPSLFPGRQHWATLGNTGQHWGACTKCWGVGV